MNWNKDYLIGYAFGVLHGISLRSDVPESVKDLCREAYKIYKEWEKVEEVKE